MDQDRTDEVTPADGGRPAGARERIGRRAWVRSVALVGSGLIAGGIVAGTVTASAAERPADPTTTQEDRGPRGDHGWHGDHGRHGEHSGPRHDGEGLTGDTAAGVEEAVLAEYPDADVRRLEAEDDGGYEAHIRTADGGRLHLLLDEEFAITGTETRPDC